jgi:hypothetical protein
LTHPISLVTIRLKFIIFVDGEYFQSIGRFISKLVIEHMQREGLEPPSIGGYLDGREPVVKPTCEGLVFAYYRSRPSRSTGRL